MFPDERMDGFFPSAAAKVNECTTAVKQREVDCDWLKVGLSWTDVGHQSLFVFQRRKNNYTCNGHLCQYVMVHVCV